MLYLLPLQQPGSRSAHQVSHHTDQETNSILRDLLGPFSVGVCGSGMQFALVIAAEFSFHQLKVAISPEKRVSSGEAIDDRQRELFCKYQPHCDDGLLL